MNELSKEKLVKRLDEVLEFQGIEDKNKRDEILREYPTIISTVGYFFDEHRMAHIMMEMKEKNVTESDWLNKIENDKAIINKWNPPWEQFVDSISTHFPQKIQDYFKGTKIVFGYTTHLALARRMICYNLILQRDNGEILSLSINDAVWKQIRLLDDKYDIFKRESNFKERFELEKNTENDFHDALEAFGLIQFCNEMNNVVDQYSWERKQRSDEENDYLEAQAKFFTMLLKKTLE